MTRSIAPSSPTRRVATLVTGTVVGIEAKATASAGRSDFRGLRLMRERLGERFAFGALLYTGPATVPFGDRLAAIPLQGLWAGA
jgi:uncharacterized protein